MIPVIDTLKSMGNYPVVNSSEVGVGGGSMLDDALDNKVDKVSGKGLSTNDYSASDKSKLNELSAIFTKVEE